MEKRLALTSQHIAFRKGYKLGAAKTAEEYAKLDAEDDSLARWKASLGIVPGADSGAASGPKVRLVLSLSLPGPDIYVIRVIRSRC